MPAPKKLHKWHFLALGVALIFLSVYLWYWNWRHLGIPLPLRPEHFITLASFIVGFLVLVLFVVRLTRRQITIMLIGLVLANLFSALVTLWIYRSYPAFFSLIRPLEIEAYDPAYVADWQTCFLTPALYVFHGGLLLLWAESLIMYFIRKPSDQPE